MANATSILFGRYSIFSRADSTIEIEPVLDAVARRGHLSSYIAIGCVLLVACLFRSNKQKKAQHVDVPFYNAAKTKWFFDAETLVRDSYNKVYLAKASIPTYHGR
jgi:hypothetical protein